MSGQTNYSTVGDIVIRAAEYLRPPERISVSDAAQKYVKLNQPGAYVGDFLNSTTPYMVEPMDTTASRKYIGEIFVGPAQCAKTQALILNVLAYHVVVDPMDMIIYSQSQSMSRDFAVRRVDRLHDHSPDVGKLVSRERDADNKTDKRYESGMILTLSHPSKNELSGKPVGVCVITDRDRMDDDIDGEGEIFDLAMKRTTTFGSFAMTVAESSPSKPIIDPKWIRTSPHQAPPCKGILGLYNRGDRRRWYWPCLKCGSYFEGNFKMITYDDSLPNTLAKARSARMICPNPECSHKIHPNERQRMQMRGRWLKDGQGIDRDGTIWGEGPVTDIASFWLNGVAAAFTTWAKLVSTYITANEELDRTGSEAALMKFYNTDLGEPYVPKAQETVRLPEVLMARAENICGTKEEPQVPLGVRFLAATVDVQANMFVVQVHGVSPGQPFDITVVDRFSLILNEEGRIGRDGQTEWIKPGSYTADWDLLIDGVIKKTYPLADGSGRRMTIKLTACDSGGREGVTTNAYAFYRRLVSLQLASRFCLVKGDHILSRPRARMVMPDANDRKNIAAARGDVPVWLLNSQMLKDELANRLNSITPGQGMIRFPKWLEPWWFKEMCAEQRTEKGWEKASSRIRNEAWDLMYYLIGISIGMLNIERMDWKSPPGWAADWDTNSLIVAANSNDPFAPDEVVSYDFGEMARALA